MHLTGFLTVLLVVQLHAILVSAEPIDRCFPAKIGDPSLCARQTNYRTPDGSCNNKAHILWGSSNIPFTRLLTGFADLKKGARYFDPDGIDGPLGHPLSENSPDVPTPHEVSANLFSVHVKNHGNSRGFSMLHMVWGQFIDHDMSLQAEDPNRGCDQNPKCEDLASDFKNPCFPILFERENARKLQLRYNPTPPGPGGKRCTPFGRTQGQCQTLPRHKQQPRTPVNILTAYLDVSMVYGNSLEEFEKIADFGTGFIRMGDNDLLPINRAAVTPCKDSPSGCFLAGDIRIDEHNALAAIHTILAREHNRIAKALKSLNPGWNGEKIFYETRKIMGGLIQHIMYEEYIPTLTTLPPYKGYNPNVNPGILTDFATAAFRFGHTLIPNLWPHLNTNFDEFIPAVTLRNLFFDNSRILQHGIEPILFGTMGNESEAFDRNFAESVSRFLFVPPDKTGFVDLTAINMQRARDHGLPSYWHFRKFCGFGNSKSWNNPQLVKDIPDPSIRNLLRQIYNDDITLVDLFAGGVSETPVPGKAVGRTFACIIENQFTRLRDGDRFYYEKPNVFTAGQLQAIKRMSLARIMCNNMKGIVSLQRNVFFTVPKHTTRPVCDSIPNLDLSQWQAAR